jgi:hypothetical protein
MRFLIKTDIHFVCFQVPKGQSLIAGSEPGRQQSWIKQSVTCSSQFNRSTSRRQFSYNSQNHFIYARSFFGVGVAIGIGIGF